MARPAGSFTVLIGVGRSDIRSLIRNGKTVSAIARTLGVSVNTLYRRFGSTIKGTKRPNRKK